MSITMDEEIKRWTARRKSALVLECRFPPRFDPGFPLRTDPG